MSTYDWPTSAALLQKNMLFQCFYSQQDAPKVLFRHSKDCQEVQILGKGPCTHQQLLNNAVHCCCSVASTTANLTIGTARHPRIRSGQISRHSSKKGTPAIWMWPASWLDLRGTTKTPLPSSKVWTMRMTRSSHLSGRVDYAKSSDGHHRCWDNSGRHSGHQSTCCEPAKYATTVSCVHHPMQHCLPTATHCWNFHPCLSFVQFRPPSTWAAWWKGTKHECGDSNLWWPHPVHAICQLYGALRCTGWITCHWWRHWRQTQRQQTSPICALCAQKLAQSWANVLQHHHTICKLECMFFLWFWCGRWPYI